MTRITDSIWFSRTVEYKSNSTKASSGPRLILLLVWVAAQDIHLAKYVTQYRLLCPDATFILFKARVASITWPGLTLPPLAPAVSLIKAALESHGEDNDDWTLKKKGEAAHTPLLQWRRLPPREPLPRLRPRRL